MTAQDLYPYLRGKVITPAGEGVLLQVFEHRVCVALDSEAGKPKGQRKAWYGRPEEVRPKEGRK